MNEKIIKKYSSLAFKKYREKYGLFLAEGHHLIDELLKSHWEPEHLITSNGETFRKLNSIKKAANLELVKPAIIEKIATTKTPQEILGIVKIPRISTTNLTACRRIIIADRIKDPGNMGTIIRTARAFGFDAVITTPSSVDIFNPKVIRATQGAMFGIRLFFDIKIKEIGENLRPTHTFYSLDPRGNIDIDDIYPDDRHVLMVGSEIEGVSESLSSIVHYKIRIPHTDSVNSLNAAVAAGIAMHRFSATY
ncbi:MAG: RNA methyltransferase [Candidatus Zixiibacteriota bacterium]|nr:MAG: RNA methyltransferase [candidate division Zixibacteria bacterium]